MTRVCTITTTSNVEVSNVSKPPIINGRMIGVGKVTTSSANLPETVETILDKSVETPRGNGPITFDSNDCCKISEVIMFLQNLAKSPKASAMNIAFTKHITNALLQVREEKLKHEASIPRKLEDGWNPIIKTKVNGFDCNALCDLGASISVMPKEFYDMLDLPPLEPCHLDVHLADNAKKKTLGRIDDVLIMVNNNLFPIDFVI